MMQSRKHTESYLRWGFVQLPQQDMSCIMNPMCGMLFVSEMVTPQSR
jgi:hypothetical protein